MFPVSVYWLPTCVNLQVKNIAALTVNYKEINTHVYLITVNLQQRRQQSFCVKLFLLKIGDSLQ
jgi:hypothetical protein